MIIIGIICLVIGFVAAIHILWIIGIILVVIGLILMLLSFRPYAGTGPAPWYHRRYY